MKERFLKKGVLRRAKSAVCAFLTAAFLAQAAVLPAQAGEIIQIADSGTAAAPSWTLSNGSVASLRAAQTSSQLCIVAASGTRANISLHNRGADGAWYQVFACEGFIGANGLGKQVRGDRRTPVGIYHFTNAFGINPNPGVKYFPYYQVDERYYWVGTGDHPYFNELVISSEVPPAGFDGEHIIDYGLDYHYVLSIDWNKEKNPYKGSAIFFHVESGSPTAGCVSMPESNMIQLITNARPDCTVIIDAADRIGLY